MAFNYEDFKARWRALAAERGIDPEQGATAFQAVDAQTEVRKDTHYQRQRRAVYNDTLKPDAWKRYDNGHGEVDTLKVERQAGRSWWAYSEYWRGGGRHITIHRPKWTDRHVRTSNRGYVTVEFEIEDEQVEMVVSRIPPPDVDAFRSLIQQARALEDKGEERSLREDRIAATREGFEEFRAERAAYLASLPVQMAFDFAS